MELNGSFSNDNMSFEEKVAYTLKNGGRYADKEVRKMVYKENCKLFNNWDEALLGDRKALVLNTKVYKKEFLPASLGTYNTVFGCCNADCVDVAEQLIGEGYAPAILNLASNIKPCGGYDDGASAQEESLCRASTLSQSLYQFGNTRYKGPREANLSQAGFDYKSWVYPLEVNFGGIFSPNVCFFRNNKRKLYSLREKTFTCGVITVASLSNREKNKWTNGETSFFNTDGTLKPEGRMIETNKIRTIFRIGLDNCCDALVLGAFGCGAYNLLPAEVSLLFWEVLNEAEFKNKFKKVVFAILEGKGRPGRPAGPDGKFKPFYDRFSQ